MENTRARKILAKSEEAYNDGYFIGKRTKCKCGAVYHTSEIVVEEDPEIDERGNRCRFCNAFLGYFDGSTLVRGPSLLWEIKKGMIEHVVLTSSAIGWFFRSLPFIIKYRNERVGIWIKGLMRRKR